MFIFTYFKIIQDLKFHQRLINPKGLVLCQENQAQNFSTHYDHEKDDKGEINRIKSRERGMWNTKETTIIYYFAKLSYVIMMSHIDNVSVNPGF